LICLHISLFTVLTATTIVKVPLLIIEYFIHQHQPPLATTPVLVAANTYRLPVRALSILFRITIALLSIICLQVIFFTILKTSLLIVEHTLQQLFKQLVGFHLD